MTFVILPQQETPWKSCKEIPRSGVLQQICTDRECSTSSRILFSPTIHVPHNSRQLNFFLPRALTFHNCKSYVTERKTLYIVLQQQSVSVSKFINTQTHTYTQTHAHSHTHTPLFYVESRLLHNMADIQRCRSLENISHDLIHHMT